jgi:hypothetical protein
VGAIESIVGDIGVFDAVRAAIWAASASLAWLNSPSSGGMPECFMRLGLR